MQFNYIRSIIFIHFAFIIFYVPRSYKKIEITRKSRLLEFIEGKGMALLGAVHFTIRSRCTVIKVYIVEECELRGKISLNLSERRLLRWLIYDNSWQ